ncbi:MAG: hypothetical protein IPM27_10170 [Nitrosomonadales bacterium]|nr:hypothetical protein [Nitrosomonadales bacterium]
MKQCLLLQLSADRLNAQHMVHGKIAAQRVFTDSEEGRDNFASFLKAAKCPAYLLVDLIEEDFRHESVPHLIGGTRTALLQRKFEQFYRGTPFRQATLLQRQKTGRRDDDMLFSALTNPALVLPWVEVLQTQKIPLVGIYSVPQISTPLIKDHPSNHLLLISWEKFSGLRQTYFSGHRLQISRLSPVHAGLSFQQAVVTELTRTYQYLKSLSLLPTGQTLDVRILCHNDDRVELKTELPKSGDMRYDFTDIAELAGQLKIDHRCTDSDASQIFLHYLMAKPPQINYANAEHTHYNTVRQLRLALGWTAGAILFGSLAWSAADVWQSIGDVSEADSLTAQAQRIQREAQQITLSFPNTHAPASDMKAVVSVMRNLDDYKPLPRNVLEPVSSALERHPKIELNELAWEMDPDEPVAENTLAGVPAQVITLKARLVGFDTEYRAALGYLEHFRNDLTAQGYQVTMLSEPLDVSPKGNITDQRMTNMNTLEFSLKLSRRPPA